MIDRRGACEGGLCQRQVEDHPDWQLINLAPSKEANLELQEVKNLTMYNTSNGDKFLFFIYLHNPDKAFLRTLEKYSQTRLSRIVRS
jgi:hypothetical protein